MSRTDPSRTGDPYDSIPRALGLGAIVAVGRGGAIGRAGALPWHIPSELAHFRRVTTGHVVVMGSRTWNSIGRALPGRRLIVVSSRDLEVPDGVEVVAGLDRALERALAGDAAPLVAGGALVYGACLPRLRRLWWSDVDLDVPGADAVFPALGRDRWDEVAAWPGEDPRVTHRVFDRRG